MNVASRATIAWGTLATAALAAVLAFALIPADADAGKTKKVRLMAPLKGKHTVPGPGDPDGSGKLKLAIKIKAKKKPRLCYELDVRGLGGVREAKIRKGAKDKTGPSVLRLFKVAEPVTGEGVTKGCRRVKRDVVRALRRDPSGHYAEVENTGYPQGALRGQLRRLGG